MTLAASEVNAHCKYIEAAMIRELITWAQYKCFSRKRRREAKHIIDCRWVLKWSWDKPTTDAQQNTQHNTQARRVIRARLTVRGFKDIDKGYIDNYAGTSQGYSQRLLVSEAVLRGWDLCTADIRKAILQGVTCEDLSELTGEPIR